MFQKAPTADASPPAPVPRAILAEAIAAWHDADRIAGVARASVERAETLVAEAEAHAKAVTIALASARNGHAARLRAAAEGGVIEAPASTREARFAELDAAEELEAARSVLAECNASAADADDDARRAQRRVEAAVAPILAGEIDRLIAEAEGLRAQLDGKYSVLTWLRSFALPGSEESQKIGFAVPPPPPGVRAPDCQPPAEWVAARSTLLVDPTAALPR